MRKSTLTLLLTGILSLVYVNGIAWRYATIRNEGKTVYLELAPVDPISLVQGQYMQLAFDIESWSKAVGATGASILARRFPRTAMASMHCSCTGPTWCLES